MPWNISALPLEALASERNFKVVFLDVGLMQNLCGLSGELLAASDILAVHAGAVAEQFVGQEFLAAGQPDLYYWAREAKSSTAEVDYILAGEGRTLPVEVKSGSSGRLKSMHLFLKQYPQSPRGYVLSCAPYSELPEQKLVFLPLYYAYSLALIKE